MAGVLTRWVEVSLAYITVEKGLLLQWRSWAAAAFGWIEDISICGSGCADATAASAATVVAVVDDVWKAESAQPIREAGLEAIAYRFVVLGESGREAMGLIWQ